MTEKLLEVDDVVTQFETEEGTVEAVNGISFSLEENETLGIVGESGSGKSVTALTIMQLIESPGQMVSGDVYYRGEPLSEKSEKELQSIRGEEIAMIFQDPMTSLNPVFTIGFQIQRVIRTHSDMTKSEAKAKTIELLDQVGIPDPEERLDDYPHQFSGGMRQRVLIAMAISRQPDILIADEPTTALDVTIEAQIFDLLDDISEEYGMSVILITHDLGVVAGACDRLAVMYSGRMVEKASTDALFDRPRHPYTRGLLRSIPRLGSGVDELDTISGSVPNPANLPTGCSFHPRCPHATEECKEVDPELRPITSKHEAACLHTPGWMTSKEETSGEDLATTDGGSMHE